MERNSCVFNKEKRIVFCHPEVAEKIKEAVKDKGAKMSDAIRCANCGYVYWSRAYENWATCDKCGTDNDQISYEAEIQPILVSSEFIFQTIPYKPVPEEPKQFNRYTALTEGHNGS